MDEKTAPAISTAKYAMTEKPPLLVALQDELQRLVHADDFGAPSLLVIQKVARAGRKLLIAADPRVRLNKSYFEDHAVATEEFSGDEGDGLPEQTPPNSAETYGATLAREILPAIQKIFKKDDDLEEIREQIKRAREDGMDEEVAILQDRLRGKRRRLDVPAADDYLEQVQEDIERIKKKHKETITSLDGVPRPSTLPVTEEEQS